MIAKPRIFLGNTGFLFLGFHLNIILKCINKIIPHIQINWKNILSCSLPHYHTIEMLIRKLR